MSRDAYELLIFGGLVAVLSFGAGLIVRRWWLSSLVAAALAGVIVPLYAVAENSWRARPSDVAFWLPMMALYSVAVATPFAFAIGFILYLIRKRKARV
jgi:hypothetical protein